MSYLARKTAQSFGYLSFTVFIFLLLSPVTANAGINDALKAIDKKQWQTASAQGARLSDKKAKAVFDWFAIINSDPSQSFEKISRFINTHPDFPSQHSMKKRAEEVMPSGLSSQSIVQWFDKNSAVTGDGMMRYIAALTALRQTSKAKDALNEWWKKASLTRDEQRDVYQQYQNYFTRDAHVKRFDYLVWNKKYDQASGMSGVLGGYYPALLEARKALKQSKANANSLLSSLPAAALNNEGVLFDRLQYRRKKELNSGAIEILNRAPPASQMYEAKAWWKERHIIVRRLIEQGNYKKAYALASKHKQVEGFPMSQAEWVSGWLALQYINQPYKAFEHFEKLYNNVESPISRARGAYWSGRASSKLGHSEIAAQWFRVAAQYPSVFYGQLANKELNQPLRLAFPKVSTNKANAIVTQSALGKGVGWFRQAGMNNTAERILRQMIDNAKTEEDYIAVAELAKKNNYTNVSIAAAQKLERNLGITSIKYLYPTLPNAGQYSNGLEVAAVFAIIRQESRFDKDAISHASARGLMQLMPATAKETARKLGVSHQTGWLTTKPYHNIRLGSSYLRQMINRYEGHYYLAAAAYNAGPGRVDLWLREIGDPRKGQISKLDWIERIPIYETRNYAQRVSEAVELYRLILPPAKISGKTHM